MSLDKFFFFHFLHGLLKTKTKFLVTARNQQIELPTLLSSLSMRLEQKKMGILCMIHSTLLFALFKHHLFVLFGLFDTETSMD